VSAALISIGQSSQTVISIIVDVGLNAPHTAVPCSLNRFSRKSILWHDYDCEIVTDCAREGACCVSAVLAKNLAGLYHWYLHNFRSVKLRIPYNPAGLSCRSFGFLLLHE
jgi:hypothetical protein